MYYLSPEQIPSTSQITARGCLDERQNEDDQIKQILLIFTFPLVPTSIGKSEAWISKEDPRSWGTETGTFRLLKGLSTLLCCLIKINWQGANRCQVRSVQSRYLALVYPGIVLDRGSHSCEFTLGANQSNHSLVLVAKEQLCHNKSM